MSYSDTETVRNLICLIVLISVKAFSQVQPNPQLDIYMRQMYAQELARQQQLQTATISPQDRLRMLQAVNMGNQQYAVQFVPQSGPNMGQTMWGSYNPNATNPLFNFFNAMGAMTKFPDKADRMEARESFLAYRSPDPEERTEPAREALASMNAATNKLKDMKNPNKPVECHECITDPQPTLTAGPTSGKGTIKTSASGQIKEDLNADIKCSYAGEVIDGIRLTFKATLEAKIEHNKVISFKYTAEDGKKSCVFDLAKYPQKKIGNTTNVSLQHPNGKTFIAIYPNNKSPDRKNPSVSFGINNFHEVCPQMNQRLFMQIEADPKTGTCR